MSVAPLPTTSAPQSQTMDDHATMKDKIMQFEIESSGKCRNVLCVIMAALYGMAGCPACCCFCCGCCGSFPAAPLMPADNDIREALRKMPQDERRLLNCDSHAHAASLGCSPCSLLSACVCCGMCGRCGPYSAARTVNITSKAK